MKYLDEFRSPHAVGGLVQKIKEESPPSVKFMEVCGTHTMAISRFGLRPLLASKVELVSGPGCPVCVTSDADIDRAIAISQLPDVTVATFGDMMKVPGSRGSLADAVSRGADVRVVYSPLEALEMARSDEGRKVVFLGVGFETTAPAIAATVQKAMRDSVGNFFLLSFLKVIPPALRVLAGLDDFSVDGFILPGHVSATIGSRVYSFLPDEFGIPCVITGFEPTDILQAIYRLTRMQGEAPSVEIEYSRVVKPGGNPRAIAVMNEVFEPAAALWRGLFEVQDSGLSLRAGYKNFDAGTWNVEVPPPAQNKGCMCGDVLCGKIKPFECPLFAVKCTPEEAVGPCMVSSEGTCASYYLYDRSGDGPID